MKLPWLSDKDRRRAKKLYPMWTRGRNAGPWEQPGELRDVDNPGGTMQVRHLPGKKGKGTVVLGHPDRRYGGYWFVKEGWVEALHNEGYGVVWFNHPGYADGNDGSPYLGENILAAAAAARDYDSGPVRVIGLSLSAFAAAIVAPHMPWVKCIILESPYPRFQDWYKGKGMSAGRPVMMMFSVLFRRTLKHLNATNTLAAATMPVMISATKNDTTTALELSQATGAKCNPTWYVGEAEHLHLWQEERYRKAVLDFLK